MEKLPTITDVVAHPTVLLSVVDHYNREARVTSRRVVGTLLGEMQRNTLHVTNSFAVPFEEDASDPTVWYFDHNYHEKMFKMFKKVNAREQVVGWYSTGPKIKPADLEIHEIYRRYCLQPVYLIVNPSPKDLVVPADAYLSFEVPSSDDLFRRTFLSIPATIGAYEAEEVGVEHLLRDLKNASTSTLATRVSDKLSSLRMLVTKLQEISEYLGMVLNNKLPQNYAILQNLQEIFSSLPDMESDEMVKSFAIESNDSSLLLYLGSIVRAIVALHDFVNNKLEYDRNLESRYETRKLGLRDSKPDPDSVGLEEVGGEGSEDSQAAKKSGESTGKND